MNEVVKITPTQLENFICKFTANRNSTYKHLRLGQAFMNEFYPNVACPEIFYEENEEKAVGLIIDNFVDLQKETLLDALWR